jgi:hypothetical protein
LTVAEQVKEIINPEKTIIENVQHSSTSGLKKKIVKKEKTLDPLIIPPTPTPKIVKKNKKKKRTVKLGFILFSLFSLEYNLF